MTPPWRRQLSRWPDDGAMKRRNAKGNKMLINGIERRIAPYANLSRADLSRADLSRADLNRADLNRADLRDAYLRDAYLRDADLRGADLSAANLSDANLSDANLSDANLSDANLSDANLSCAKIDDQAIVNLVARAGRMDGYEFLLFRTETGHIIRAGCQTRTIESYREHVAADYPGTAKARETLAILAYFETRLADDGRG